MYFFLNQNFVVTRIEAKSEKFDMFMHLDINTEIYPMKEREKFSMALSSTLNEDGTPDTGYYTQVNLFLPFFFIHISITLPVFSCLYSLFFFLSFFFIFFIL